MYLKVAVVFIALGVISVNTAPVDQLPNASATILEYNYEPNANNDGGYRLLYRTSDGQSRTETASVKYVGEENVPVLSINGIYSYIGSDGITYTTNYSADENGFNAFGIHLPGMNMGILPTGGFGGAGGSGEVSYAPPGNLFVSAIGGGMLPEGCKKPGHKSKYCPTKRGGKN